jgi:hypothetical protein
LAVTNVSQSVLFIDVRDRDRVITVVGVAVDDESESGFCKNGG